MPKPTLVIGSKNYSSWSLRPWLLMRRFDIDFDEIKLPLDTPEFYRRIRDYSPSGRVPALIDGDVRIWDSLAIMEYVNERFLDGRGWPADGAARATARAICAEMHSGFGAMRGELPLNCRKRVRDHAMSEAAVGDIARVKSIWRQTRADFGRGGVFLFGDFSIADAMYAPVVLRFVSYGVPLEETDRAYADTILALPPLVDWLREAETEQLAPLHEQTAP